MTITTKFDDTRFRQLLARWNQHQGLKSSGASIAELAGSRAALDAARLAAYRAI